MSLQADLRAPILTDVSLRSFTTFKIGGRARYFVEPESREDLVAVLAFAREEECPFYLLGRGSNLLFSDDGYDGLVISMRKFDARRISFEGDGYVQVPASVSLIQLNMACQSKGLSGVEFMCHIPGTVGGALVMNAGFGRPEREWREMKDVVASATMMYRNGAVRILDREDINFEYRKTDIPQDCIVMDVMFRLKRTKPEAVQREINENFNYRNSVQDLRYPSAGSTFKNPRGSNLSSGQLLDRVHMKGVRVGDAMVSKKHANFILNVDHAESSDVLTLMGMGRKRVFEAYGIDLEAEVRYVENPS